MLSGRDELGHRSETVRRANLSAIVRELHESGPMSRSDLVTRTGLTRSAIRGLIGELVAGDLASESPAALDGTPGRPSPVVEPRFHRRDRARVRDRRRFAGRGCRRAGRTSAGTPSDRPSARALERRRHRQCARRAGRHHPRTTAGDRHPRGSRNGGRRRHPSERRDGVDGAEPRLARRAARRPPDPRRWTCRSRSPSPTSQISPHSRSIGAGRRAASTTSSSCGGRWASGAGSSSMARR